MAFQKISQLTCAAASYLPAPSLPCSQSSQTMYLAEVEALVASVLIGGIWGETRGRHGKDAGKRYRKIYGSAELAPLLPDVQ